MVKNTKVIIITGASRGLGREVALRFGRAGWRVVVNYAASQKAAEAVAAEVSASGGVGFAYRADVSVPDEAEGMVARTLARFGRVDVLVNNAGVARPGLIAKLSDADWDATIDANLKGPFYCIKSVSRVMLKQKAGHIVNVSSILGLRGKAGQAAYAASKAGLIGLTKAAAVELGSRGVRVNAVLPGYMLTDMGAGASGKYRAEALADNLLGRFSEPAEVADFIFHLARMKAVSGQVFNLDSRVV
ncbi:MAG: SDR family NAD(P)-dependent oxidoreductase [Nitrospirae bacterium]|nr:SDR family NAD(P)-dependent oxidoreductase [Nitrospirota bacterium]